MARKSKKLNELCVLFEENNITAKTIEDNDEVIYELKKGRRLLMIPDTVPMCVIFWKISF